MYFALVLQIDMSSSLFDVVMYSIFYVLYYSIAILITKKLRIFRQINDIEKYNKKMNERISELTKTIEKNKKVLI